MYCRGLLVLIAALLTAACSSKKDVAPTRYAVLRFENLTSDPSLDWVGRAASEVLIKQIEAISSSAVYAANEHFGRRPLMSPGVSTELTDAILAGGNHIITGYFDRLPNGTLEFHLAEEEGPTGKRVRSLSAQGSVLEACNNLAKQITAKPKPYPTNNIAALHAYIQGVEGEGPIGAGYQAAIAADPEFGDAYLALGELALARRDAGTVDQVLTAAVARKLDPAVIAKLQLADASAHNDTSARTAALERMIETEPTNLSALQALGEAQMASHRFAEAAATFGKGAPETIPEMVNLKAYALMFHGDEKGALNAARQLQNLRPKDPNAIDSEGDIQYYFGHFAEAEKLYLAASTMNAQFNLGLETWKAARAHLMTGDVAGASEIFARYRAEREKAKDLTLPFRVAYWQFLAGDSAGSLAAMHQIASTAVNPTLKSLALSQAAIWELQAGRRPDARKDAQESMQAERGGAAIPAVIVSFSSLEPAGLAELNARAARMFTGAAGAQIRSLSIAFALYFGNRNEEAVTAWKEIYEKSDPADPVARSLYGTLLMRTGHQSEGAALLKNIPPPPTALSPSFECLYVKPGNTAKPTK